MGFHEDCLVVDGHTDVPTRLWEEPADLSRKLADRHVDLPRLQAGGVDALVFALFVPASLSPRAGLAHARELYDLSVERLVPGRLEMAETAAEVRRAAARGVVAALFGLENGRPLSVPGALGELARLGVRYVTLTHVSTHEWCDASTDQARHGGLSREGAELVREMGRRGILPDVSHASDAAVEHTLEVARGPVIASHSSARALCDHPRNLPDRLVRELARQGGIVMANTYPAFVGAAAARANDERLKEIGPALEELADPYLRDPRKHWREIAELMASHPLPEVGLDAFADHVVHLVELAGEEHVGIGTDFDGIPDVLRGFEDPSRFPDLTAALLDRGFDEGGVRLILGESFLRVLEAAERQAG